MTKLYVYKKEKIIHIQRTLHLKDELYHLKELF